MAAITTQSIVLNVNSRKEFMAGTTVTVTGAAGLTVAVLHG